LDLEGDRIGTGRGAVDSVSVWKMVGSVVVVVGAATMVVVVLGRLWAELDPEGDW
jgi:hypothetical protein